MNYNYLNLIKLYQDNLRANNSNLGFYVALDGFSKGNMDSTLYNQFENKVPRKLDEKNPLNMLMAYQFALIDLQLFLDVNPNNKVVKDLFDRYLNEYLNAKKEYESKYGPITLDSKENKGPTWKWQNKWPFDGGNM